MTKQRAKTDEGIPDRRSPGDDYQLPACCYWKNGKICFVVSYQGSRKYGSSHGCSAKHAERERDKTYEKLVKGEETGGRRVRIYELLGDYLAELKRRQANRGEYAHDTHYTVASTVNRMSGPSSVRFWPTNSPPGILMSTGTNEPVSTVPKASPKALGWARLSGLTRGRLSQILLLANLAPEIQEQLLFLPKLGNTPDRILEKDLRHILHVVEWHEQAKLVRSIWVGSHSE